MEVSDAALVLRVRNQSREQSDAAFAILVERYQDYLRGMLHQLCRNRAQAEDLAQAAFFKAWRKLDSLRDPARFGAWLKQLAYREFLHDYRRYKLILRQASMETEPSAHVDPLPENLQLLLAQCSPIEAELLILSYAFEFTQAEIAAARGMSVGTVKSHLHRAKARISTWLENSQLAGTTEE
jgi:RNA polymerase sigma-70 factor (ECF subfamily)